MMNLELKYFKTDDFHAALRLFFKSLNIPVNYIAEESVRPQDILEKSYKKDHSAHQLMEDVYFLGMVDDNAFAGNASLAPEKIESDYDGILIFGVTLNQRENNLLPTRSQLAEITRSFNREFCYTPVVVVFKYENINKNYIAFANAERLKFKQEWREGEKAGKVSLLRDIDLDNPHSGHLQILSELAISRSGKKAVNSFTDLYTYWQTVFNVSLLNKKFYEELSNWYFWAIKEVTFPSQPTLNEIIKETGKKDNQRLEDLIHEHNAKNVIRLLTRFLFVWFIKEKNLVPEELFDLEYLKNEILNDFSPYHVDDKNTLFELINIDTKSNYYKAILQNLFFATLNCPLEKKAGKDKRNRGFSKKNFGVLHLMRYEKKFKNSDLFLEMMNNNVPFLNGGLFECLDKRGEREKREERIYIDGFSDNLPKEHDLIVPDYLFFGLNEKVDLSSVVGIKNKKTEQAMVKGLINIFKSYKFTIAENTPIEEDIALDPELLGKVFENLLASYNPETKTTARKQTGSFYTPREIVNYMVDESLIAYLKNAVKDWCMSEDELDSKLHQLLSFDPVNPFENDQSLQKKIIKALDHCTILDPACGSGAFPMGILQKMVHVLQKIDPLNSYWQELQMKKALQETESVFRLADKETRKQKLIEINEAFDTQINDPDYARKLFLIENCIYGVDIQPIAAQISKLRFFISLVVDQKVDITKENFGIRPLPNLETKFVAANTLIGIEKPVKQGNLFTNPEINELEEKLKVVRHRIFSIKKPQRKKELRQEDQILREKMGNLLVADGWQSKSARQLADWDPYDQNASSAFFDSEWMFGIKDGFDVVIGNPPYGAKLPNQTIEILKQNYQLFCRETAILFIEKGQSLLSKHGILTYIVPKALTYASNYKKTRNFLLNGLGIMVDCGKAFEQVKLEATVFCYQKSEPKENYLSVLYSNKIFFIKDIIPKKYVKLFGLFINGISRNEMLIGISMAKHEKLSNFVDNTRGAGLQKYLSCHSERTHPAIGGIEIDRYHVKKIKGFVSDNILDSNDNAIIHNNSVLCQNIIAHIQNPKDHIKITCYIPDDDRYIILDTINQLHVTCNNFSKFYLWSLLNSVLINWFVYRFIYGKAIRTMHFDNPVSSRIPLVYPENCDIFRTLHYCIVNAVTLRLVFENIMNALIFQLYFPDHMKEKQIDILQFIEKDLAEVMQDRDFKQLSDSEKENIINQLHARWSHPDSEVRNRIKLFAVRSPDILKPILGSK
ncbi:MAG: Eco57I restriction-modification methylase domain-containing protein [Deltaproteobacteria bacterium]|nr:Eco57I restriction-modification methylase domain-containing protein [Candidatus Tharpella aukensis]